MIEGNLVDVVTGEITPVTVELYRGNLVRIEEKPISTTQYIIPGMIDAHIHIESSLLCPSRFAQIAVTHGVTSVIADPHEIANVMGMKGIEYFLKDSAGTPMRFFFTAPPCVPPTPWETSGAVLGWREVRELLQREEFVALGEVMNYPAVLNDDPDIMGKIEVARELGMPVDGHCPGLTGPDLEKYIFAGISTDHECITWEEAEEKYRKGMKIMVREGSASRNLRDLMPFARKNECFLVTDDMHVDELLKGYLDKRLKLAVEYGMDPINAVRAVTYWPARHYGLPVGRVEVGMPADFVIVDDLKSFNVREVYIDGRLVARDGRPLFDVRPHMVTDSIVKQDRSPLEFMIPHSGKKAVVRVIQVLPDKIESLATTTELDVRDGFIRPDPAQDIAVIAVVNRYKEAPPALGFIKGFGLKRGAIASSVAHDTHNLVAVGIEPGSLAAVVNKVSEYGGFTATDGSTLVSIKLDIAGLMSTSPPDEVAESHARVVKAVRNLGCQLPEPFMTLSFQCLLVVPELKMSDKGLFDSKNMKFIDPVVE